MNNYAILNPNGSFLEERSLDPNWVNSLIEAGNPKANTIRPLVQDEEPEYDPETQELEFGGYAVEQNQVRKTWNIRELSPEEIAEKNRKVWTAYQFLLRFTAEERALLRSASISDPYVADFSQLLSAAQEVISDDPVTLQAMGYLVYAEYITNERKMEIMGEI
jgi:hypothetical protein